VGNHGNLGSFEVRNTRGVSFDGIEITGFVNKGINTNFVDGVTYSHIALKDGSGGADGAGFYFGHFNRDSVLHDCSFETAAEYEEFIKVSHYATRTTISNCTLKGTGYVMIQAAQSLNMSNVTVETTGPRALLMLYHDGFGPLIENRDVKISNCTFVSTERGQVQPKVIELSWGRGTIFEGNRITGNVFANPTYDLTFRRNEVNFSTAYAATQIPALFFQDISGDGTCVVSDNRLQTTQDYSTVYFNGATKAANIEFTGNTVSHNSTSAYAVVANYVAAGKFLYRDNIMVGKRTSEELLCNYNDKSRVTIVKAGR